MDANETPHVVAGPLPWWDVDYPPVWVDEHIHWCLTCWRTYPCLLTVNQPTCPILVACLPGGSRECWDCAMGNALRGEQRARG